MKKITFILVIILQIQFSNVHSQDQATEKNGTDISINFLTGSTLGEFKDTYNKNVILGFNFDATFTPFNNFKAWKMGGQFEIFFGGYQKDQWNGLELKSQTAFFKLNFINRIQPYKAMMVKPFVEFAYGLNINTTSSSYVIVDEATFLEKFLFNAEDVVQNETAKEHTGINQNLAVGLGFVIKNIIVLQVKYNYVPEISYVKKDGISVVSNEITYDFSKSRMELITVGLGITFNTVKSTKMIETEE